MLYHGVWSSGRMRASGACGPSSILGTPTPLKLRRASPTFRLRSRSLRSCIYSLIWYDLAMETGEIVRNMAVLDKIFVDDEYSIPERAAQATHVLYLIQQSNRGVLPVELRPYLVRCFGHYSSV